MTVVPLVRRLAAVVVLAGLVAACGGGGGDESSDSTEADELSPVPDPLETLAEPTPGQGVAVIGIEELSFTVTACTDGPRAEDTPEATLDYLVEGEGETSDGPFQVELSRFRSDTGVGEPVLTETARVTFGADVDARGVEAKRTTAGLDGAWLDLTDPDVDAALIERRGDSFDVRGTFGPEAARAGDEGLEDGRLRARCPA
ncbi:MAG TPA: hypothetical protein VK507_16965 [Iamia sp.]|nr:hypothetical protein [Iamia sp.]